jgi:hypothetical protein
MVHNTISADDLGMAVIHWQQIDYQITRSGERVRDFPLSRVRLIGAELVFVGDLFDSNRSHGIVMSITFSLMIFVIRGD